MQIFVTNKNPYLCALRLWFKQKRAIKMITETQQILACCQKEFFGEVTILKVDGTPYATPLPRMNHPVVKWARSNIMNFKWLYKHLVFLYGEYKGDKFKNVKNNIFILKNQLEAIDYDLNSITFFNFAKADDKKLNFTHIDNVFEAYDVFLKEQGA